MPHPNYNMPSHTEDQQPHLWASPLPLLLALATILTQPLANSAPLAHSKRGLTENLLNYLADQHGDDTCSACQILPSLFSHKTKAQSSGPGEQAAQKYPSSSSLPGTEAPCNEGAAQLLSDLRLGGSSKLGCPTSPMTTLQRPK